MIPQTNDSMSAEGNVRQIVGLDSWALNLCALQRGVHTNGPSHATSCTCAAQSRKGPRPCWLRRTSLSTGEIFEQKFLKPVGRIVIREHAVRRCKMGPELSRRMKAGYPLVISLTFRRDFFRLVLDYFGSSPWCHLSRFCARLGGL